MAYYNTTIFPAKRRLVWEEQFSNMLLKTLFDEEQILKAVNEEQLISIENSPISDLTVEELQEALEVIERGEDHYFSLTDGSISEELLSKVGMAQADLDGMGFKEKFLYHTILAHAMRTLMGYENEEKPTEFKKIYSDYIAKHPEQEQYAKDETIIYFNHALSIVEPIIRAYRHFIKANQLFQIGLQKYESDSPVSQYAQKIYEDIFTMAKQVKSAEEIDTLADVTETCAKALINPSSETMQACIDKGNELSNQSFTKSLGGAMLTFAGVAIFSISVVVAIESFGLAAPLSAMGIALGESLVFGSLATGTAAVGATGGVFGSYTFFKHSQSDPLSQDLNGIAQTVCAA